MNEETLWKILNSEIFITLLLGFFAFVTSKLFTWKPKWEKYYRDWKGTIISAIKAAEKAVPDDIPHKAVVRLDQALKLILSAQGKEASQVDIAALREAVSVTHAELEKAKALGNGKTPE